MRKIRTTEQLQESLDKDFGWRLKEIASLKSAVRSPSTMSKETAVRSALTLLYAHWEGFVKHASEDYLEYVSGRSLKYNELRSCFAVFGLKKKLNDIANSKKADVSIPAFEFIRSSLDEKARLQLDSAIRTDSNLSSATFSNIARSIGIETRQYESKYKLIDEGLLKKRNSIAHGEFLDIDADGFRGLADEVIGMLRSYKTDIENAVSLESFREITHVPAAQV